MHQTLVRWKSPKVILSGGSCPQIDLRYRSENNTNLRVPGNKKWGYNSVEKLICVFWVLRYGKCLIHYFRYHPIKNNSVIHISFIFRMKESILNYHAFTSVDVVRGVKDFKIYLAYLRIFFIFFSILIYFHFYFR